MFFTLLANRVMRNPRSQRALLSLSYFWHRKQARTVTWVVGPDEIASMVRNIALALPGSHSVSLLKNRFYDFDYDSVLVRPRDRGPATPLQRLVRGPWLLGRLARQAEGFIYIGSTGYLLETGDQRDYEFAFLKSKGLALVCYFTGNDIRSPRLMRELQEQTGLENIGTYLPDVAAVFSTAAYDDTKRAIAASADKHADVVFNARVDQLSYLQKQTEPFLYFYPDDGFLESLDKFDTLDVPVVVHAPTAPILKGTQIVRSAVTRLRELGYAFEYVELINAPHEEVLAQLRRAHIALNEFYAFVPGVFGVEAMAAGCALMTRSDEHIETDLPAGSNEAWLVTASHQVFDNLKHLLDHPGELRPLAARGQAWARENAATSRSAERLRRALQST